MFLQQSSSNSPGFSIPFIVIDQHFEVAQSVRLTKVIRKTSVQNIKQKRKGHQKDASAKHSWRDEACQPGVVIIKKWNKRSSSRVFIRILVLGSDWNPFTVVRHFSISDRSSFCRITLSKNDTPSAKQKKYAKERVPQGRRIIFVRFKDSTKRYHVSASRIWFWVIPSCHNGENASKQHCRNSNSLKYWMNLNKN